jgi:hypothetical protein
MQKSAKLTADFNYVSAQAAYSGYPGGYHLALPPPSLHTPSCTAFSGGCRQYPVSNGAYVPSNLATRPNDRPSTDLFVTAVYKARGDGIIRRQGGIDTSSMLSIGQHAINREIQGCGAYKIAETDFDRWSCINAPLMVEANSRVGISSRAGLQYVNQC